MRGRLNLMEHVLPLQCGYVLRLHIDEHAIAFHRMSQLHVRHTGNEIRKQTGHIVGLPGVFQPQPVLEIRYVLGRKEPHLGGKLEVLLAEGHEVPHEILIKNDDGFGHHHAVLRSAEGHHIHAEILGKGTHVTAERNRGVGDARTVHVHEQAVRVCHVDNGLNLFRRVHRGHFRGLRERHQTGLAVVRAAHICQVCGEQEEIEEKDWNPDDYKLVQRLKNEIGSVAEEESKTLELTTYNDSEYGQYISFSPTATKPYQITLRTLEGDEIEYCFAMDDANLTELSNAETLDAGKTYYMCQGKW